MEDRLFSILFFCAVRNLDETCVLIVLWLKYSSTPVEVLSHVTRKTPTSHLKEVGDEEGLPS